MAIYHEDIVDIELKSGAIYRSFLHHSIGKGDSAANRFGVHVMRNGKEVDLSGCSCYGYFRDAQGNNIALTSNGTVNGAVAYVTLPQACYNYEGQFCLAIKLIGGGVTGTMRIVDGVVDNTNTGSAVAPTGTVPTYSEILSQYDAMVAATAAANGCIAETFDATKPYSKGKYVINEGTLYRLTANHAGGTTWANTSKVEVIFGDEINDANSAISQEIEDRTAAVGTETTNRIIDVERKVNKPSTNPNGTSGQLLKTLGNGQTQWDDFGLPTDAQTNTAVANWLNNHPEATTTVQDKSIGEGKLSDSFYNKMNAGLNNSIDLDYLATNIRHYPNDDLNIDEPSEPQGVACIGDGRVIALYCSSHETADGWNYEDDPTLLIEYQFTAEKTTSTIVREETLVGLCHANSAGYNPSTEEIYVCQRGYYSGSAAVSSSKIVVIDYTTLTIKSTVDIDMTNTGANFIDVISFDKINNKLYGFASGELFEIDIANATAETVFAAEEPYSHTGLEYITGIQGMCVIDDLCYIVTSSPNTVFVYSISNQERIKILNIPKFDPYGHAIAYTEDIDYDPVTFDIYMNAFNAIDIVGNGESGKPYKRACYIYKFNTVNGAISSARKDTPASIELGNVVYVDGSTTKIYQKGSSAYPFKTINEAILATRFSDFEYFYIVVESGTYDETIYAQGIQCSIRGQFTANGLRAQDVIMRFESDVVFTGENNANCIAIYSSDVNFNKLYATAVGENDVILTKYSDIKGDVAYLYGGEGKGIDAQYSQIDMIISSSSTAKKIKLSRSRFYKMPAPQADIYVEVAGECFVDLDNATYSAYLFEGLVSAVFRISLNNGQTVLYVESNKCRKFPNSGASCDANTWFGTLRVAFDKDLSVTGLSAIYCSPVVCSSSSGSQSPIELIDGTTVSFSLSSIILK